jgi:hypothetical protein
MLRLGSGKEAVMTIIYGQDTFFLAPGHTFHLLTVFNSNDFNAGGDYLGPIVASGFALTPNQLMSTSTVGVEMKLHTSDLTTNVVYHYSVHNDSPAPVSFAVNWFADSDG